MRVNRQRNTELSALMFGEPHAELRFNVGFELISGYFAYGEGAQYHGMKTYLQKAWSVWKFARQHSL